MVRSFLRRPSCSQSRWKTSARRRSPEPTQRQTRSSGWASILAADQRQTAGAPSPKTGLISIEAENGSVETRPVSGEP